ncbi:MAG: ATP-binding protein [Armatimonadetes bacterium]|nr:ATP-binding protein [Armatimonadota bacterium]
MSEVHASVALPFLNRDEEVARLRRFFRRNETSLAVLYGRRRLGKSRLLLETLPPGRAVYFVADDREAALQRAALAVEIGRLVPGFDLAVYPSWDALLTHWFQVAPRRATLVLDEFPELVAHASELPGILHKHVDRREPNGPHVVLCGSSQRMMQGLVLDRSAALYGRSTEILKVEPLAPGWLLAARLAKNAEAAVEAWAIWGGVPRYWELAAEFPSRQAALSDLVLNPLGVLYGEADRLLLDDLRDPAQSASMLELIGNGCHRMSEIAGRLGKPAGALVRPLQRLVDLALVRRDRPFGEGERSTKRSAYRIADSFLRFCHRYVTPNRSRLEARLVTQVADAVETDFPHFVSAAWEDLARRSVPHLGLFDKSWGPASAWWGPGTDRKPLEVDLVAESLDGSALLLGSVKWENRSDLRRIAAELSAAAARLPIVGRRRVHVAAWIRRSPRGSNPACVAVDPAQVMACLR